MSATPVTQSTRFFAPEITKCIFLPTIAAANLAATRAEIDAGTDLSNEIADLSGWTIASGTIDTPDLGNRFTRQISGRTTAEASSLTMYADKKGVDAREILPRDTVGFIVFMDGGDVPADPMDVFPVSVSSLGKVRSTGDQAGQLTINFSITGIPAEDLPIPAAV
jgi:hypothetical protein